MLNVVHAVFLGFLVASASTAAPADGDVVRVANWLVGSFDTRAQAARAAHAHDVALMVARPVDDPVVFGDALYLYVENRLEGEAQPYRQRVYRLKKSGGRIRIEAFRIDSQLLGPLALDPQMLSSLNPGDLTKESGCDVLMEPRGDGYEGSTAPRSCRSDWKGSAYVSSTIRITKDVVMTLDIGYDDKGVQTFGPPDGRGYEFRRIPR